MRKIMLASLVFIVCSNLFSQSIHYDADKKEIICENDVFSRTLKIDLQNNAFYTKRYIDKRTDYNFWREGTKEFSLAVNGHHLDAGQANGSFKYVGHSVAEGKPAGKVLKVFLTGAESTPANAIEVTLYYQVYPSLALIRKWATIKNVSPEEIVISDLTWENLRLDPWGMTGSDIYANYGRYWFKAPYAGGKDDPAILVKGQKGTFIVGNESPAIMKYTGIYHDGKDIAIGLNPSGHPYAFKKHLAPNELFKTPKGFIIFSTEEVPEDCFENDLAKYIRQYMGVKLFEREKRPLFCYNTWHPFKTGINHELVSEIADALQGTGVEYLIIDDGWQDNYGDWGINKQKFPGGLKPICNDIRDKGMKPGLWITLTTAEVESDAYKQYKQHAVKDENGEPVNLHGWANDLKFITMDLMSPWYNHIKAKVFNLIEAYGIEYLKIDFAMAKSAYVMKEAHSGSYDTTENYKGREEYLYNAYEKLLHFFDELAAKYPSVIIDCTFELWGDWHAIDYALIKHADVDWISNFTADPPKGSRDVRRLQWHHGLVIPTSCMMIGNQQMDVDNHEFSFFSNLGHTPIMLGDPRNLSEQEKEWYKKHYEWFRDMEEKYEITKYHQTSSVFPAPKKNNWDGFARFNTEQQGGIFVVFRNESPENERTFILPWVLKEKTYSIQNPRGKIIGEYRGEVLIEQGFKVNIPTVNTASAFSIVVKQ